MSQSAERPDAGMVTRLEDLRAIRAVLARYCSLVDRRDYVRVARQAFTSTAVDDHGIYGQAFRGREAIDAMFLRSNATTRCSAHYVGESAISLDSDRAIATTPVTGWTWIWNSPPLAGSHTTDWIFTGTYVDELRRTGEGWLIEERLVTPLGPGATGRGAPPRAYALDHSINRLEGTSKRD